MSSEREPMREITDPRQNYSRVQKPKETSENRSPIPANEVRVRARGRVKQYVDFGLNALEGKGKGDEPVDTLVLKATGQAINKAVQTAEVIKRRVKALHQTTEISTLEIEDKWEPKEEGLDEVITTRRVASIEIKLSREEKEIEEMKKDEICYQEPLDETLVKKQEERPKRQRRSNGQKGGKGGRGAGMGSGGAGGGGGGGRGSQGGGGSRGTRNRRDGGNQKGNQGSSGYDDGFHDGYARGFAEAQQQLQNQYELFRRGWAAGMMQNQNSTQNPRSPFPQGPPPGGPKQQRRRRNRRKKGQQMMPPHQMSPGPGPMMGPQVGGRGQDRRGGGGGPTNRGYEQRGFPNGHQPRQRSGRGQGGGGGGRRRDRRDRQDRRRDDRRDDFRQM